MSDHTATSQLELPPPASNLAAPSTESEGQASVPAMDSLAELMQAYNEVTERLQQSHEKLQGEVIRLRGELKQRDEQLQRSKRLAALGEMAAGIAHEIRNPLAAIQLYAQMVVTDLSHPPHHPPHHPPQKQASRDYGQDMSETAATASKIAEAVRGLNGIVNDVLRFASDIRPEVEPCVAGELFAHVVEAHRPAIERAAVAVKFEGNDVELEADVTLMQQVLLNLVRNAVDAMEGVASKGGVEGKGGVDGTRGVCELKLGAKRDGRGVHLMVTDTGPGLSEDQMDRIFNPFYTTRNTGTGLGLAIVHRVVDAHGGSIRVVNGDSSNTPGATFTITLPDQPDQSNQTTTKQSTIHPTQSVSQGEAA